MIPHNREHIHLPPELHPEFAFAFLECYTSLSPTLLYLKIKTWACQLLKLPTKLVIKKSLRSSAAFLFGNKRKRWHSGF